jgi:hypothetical protein
MGPLFVFDLRATAAVVLVSCLIAGGFCAVAAAGLAQNDKTVIVSVDRTNKGDRLPRSAGLMREPTSSLPTVSALRRKVPLGCDPAFSSAADPEHAGIFGRCAA